MQLWQLDIVGGVFLVDGAECKLVTGVDDHSRFCVIAAVVRRPTGRAVCAAFAAALVEFGVPDEVLTDNGKQFNARFARPAGGEVLFDRICRENGIVHRLTAVRSPESSVPRDHRAGHRGRNHPRRRTERQVTQPSSFSNSVTGVVTTVSPRSRRSAEVRGASADMITVVGSSTTTAHP
jgi:transposase InsO family protein